MSGKDLEKIATLIEEKKIKPLRITRTLPLDQAILAHELIESNQATGKIVLKPF